MTVNNMSFSSLMSLMSLLILLTSCSPFEILDVHNDFLMPDRLASAHAETPDPRLECPVIGQRLRVNWWLGSQFYDYDHVKLVVNIRFVNRTDDKVELTLLKSWGTYPYFVVNDDYCDTGGFVSYKIQIFGDDCLIDEWAHPLWQDRITVGEETLLE